MKLEVDEKACIWCGVCEYICPNVFHVEKTKFSLTGAMYVNQSEVATDRNRTVLAIEACPMACIKLVSDEKKPPGEAPPAGIDGD